MDCTVCKTKSCKTLQSCGAEKFDSDYLLKEYKQEENQKIIQAAAGLVDYFRAGTLSRIQEVIEFIKAMQYKNPGIAYCYGMEKEVKVIKTIFKDHGIKLSAVACSIGGLAQDNINENSCIHKVSCNPLGQAQQLNLESVDFVVIVGICLGHDILLQHNLKCDFTTLVVKDRVYQHNPLLATQLHHLIPD